MRQRQNLGRFAGEQYTVRPYLAGLRIYRVSVKILTNGPSIATSLFGLVKSLIGFGDDLLDVLSVNRIGCHPEGQCSLQHLPMILNGEFCVLLADIIRTFEGFFR